MSDRLIDCSTCGERIWESDSCDSFFSEKTVCRTCVDKEADQILREMEVKELKLTIEKSKQRLAELGETV